MNRACFPKEKHQNSQKWAKFMNFSFWPFLWFGLPEQLPEKTPDDGSPLKKGSVVLHGKSQQVQPRKKHMCQQTVCPVLRRLISLISRYIISMIYLNQVMATFKESDVIDPDSVVHGFAQFFGIPCMCVCTSQGVCVCLYADAGNTDECSLELNLLNSVGSTDTHFGCKTQ